MVDGIRLQKKKRKKEGSRRIRKSFMPRLKGYWLPGRGNNSFLDERGEEKIV